MVNLNELYRTIEELPPALHGQVSDYVAFLRERYVVRPAEDLFWAYMATIDPDGNAVDKELAAATNRLAQEGMETIYAFHDTLALKLQQLDTPAFWEAGGGSADGFLYVVVT